MKRILSLLLCAALLAALLPTGALAAKREKKAGPPVFRHHEFEHHYRLQEDSFEATDTEGGYRHYRCEDCGDEYSYHTDPMVYVTNPRTGELVDQAGAWNPLLPPWEHIPDPEPQVFWSRADGEWRCYLYGSHDDTGRGYCGFNYLLYSAPVYDLSDWRCEGVYLNGTDENGEVRLTSGATVGLFAPDCAYDVNTDTYWLISNEFNAYSVLRVADNPCGPWPEDEGEWFISVKAAYDPSIWIAPDGTFYIAGSCMKTVYNTYPEVEAAVAADGYKSGMSHIAVLFQLKKDMADGDGIEAISWIPTENRSYTPIYEGPSLSGWVEELGCYVLFYVSYDVQTDGTFYNSGLGWMWTDDLMHGVWHYGENGVEEFYPELDYVISGNHGNIVSDTSGRYTRDPASGELVFTEFPTYTYGNNHGGMARINGKWCFFGHRQTGRSAYSRQTLAGEVQLSVRDGVPVITPFEYSASGLAGSMPAYQPIPAYRASTLIPAVDHYAPSTENHNLHSDCLKTDPYITATRDEQAAHGTYIADLRDGSVAGFKYLDFGTEPAEPDLELLISSADSLTEAGVEVWLDAPCEEQGGVRLGVVHLTDSAVTGETETGSDGTVWRWFRGGADAPVSGLHGVYFVFRTGAGSVGFDQFSFSR